MALLAVILMLLAALWVGYHIGSSRPARKKRTRRVAMGRHAVSLVALLMVGRIERAVGRKLPRRRGWRRRWHQGLPFMP